jgi:hypothetical protein
VHQEICVSCEKRRISRLNQWLKEPERTIWLSEIADYNGRVAIIAGVFELSSWLNGNYIESMFTQSPFLHSDYKDYQNFSLRKKSLIKRNNRNLECCCSLR